MSVSGERGKRDGPRRRLEEVLDEMPKSWQLWVGSVLVGQAVRYDRAEHGSCWLCVVEEPESGDLITIFLSATVLRDELKSEKPTSGEMIGVKRLPAVEKGYKRFRLIVVGRAAAEGIPDFDETSPPGDVPPGEPTDDTAFSSEVPVSQADLPF